MTVTIVRHLFAGDTGESITSTLNGDPAKLATMTAVQFKMRSAGSTDWTVDALATIVNAATGKVRYDFDPEDIADPGIYEVIFRPTFPEGTITYPTDDYGYIQVHGADSSNLVTPDDVYRMTGETVSVRDISLAQGKVASVVDRDLSDADFIAILLPSDLRRLKVGISWQSTVTPSVIPSGLKSVTVGDVSYTTDVSGVSAQLHEYANNALSKLSWLSGKTIYVQDLYDTQISEWTTENAFYGQVVRAALPDAEYWR